MADLAADSRAFPALKDSRINLDKVVEVIKDSVTYLMNLRNSLEDRKGKGPVEQEEEWALNKARISFLPVKLTSWMQ